MCRNAVFLGTGAHVRVLGKGRKERATPLTRETAAVLKAWLREIPDSADAIVFPSARGTRLSSDGIEYLLAKYVVIAAKACPSLAHKRVTPHVLRHTAAMELLQAGVDRSLIALLLGHESVETTQIYLDANLAMKEQALAKAAPPGSKAGRYHPDDQLLAFLKGTVGRRDDQDYADRKCHLAPERQLVACLRRNQLHWSA
jgi:integrase